ncbi:hypothetical protein [Streptomyces youssoufiensis]
MSRPRCDLLVATDGGHVWQASTVWTVPTTMTVISPMRVVPVLVRWLAD